MSDRTRRTFLKQTSRGVVGAAALGAVAPNVQGARANEKVVVALIGCGGQGPGVASGVKGAGNVEIAYTCDPDDERAGQNAEKLGGKPVRDLRTVLDDQAVDAVIVATPDHWHAPAAIMALEAGKHVYVEKPCSHNIREGRLLVEAAQRTGKVVQHGTQSRSSEMINHAIRLLRDGIIGDVLVANACNVQRRPPIGKYEPSAPPARFDHDLWLGPAPVVPWQKNCHHYTWHWWYNFGTGDVGNDGVHEIDIARWGLGVETHPTTIFGSGGKLAYDDDQQFPDTAYVSFEYPGDDTVGTRRQLVFEMRLWSPYQLSNGKRHIDNGNAFYGTKGWMSLSKRGILEIYDELNRPIEVPEDRRRMPNHRENFVRAIRYGDKPRGQVAIGHLSSSLCHLANISVRLGRSLHFDPENETFSNDPEANALISREYRAGGHWSIPQGV